MGYDVFVRYLSIYTLSGYALVQVARARRVRSVVLVLSSASALVSDMRDHVARAGVVSLIF